MQALKESKKKLAEDSQVLKAQSEYSKEDLNKEEESDWIDSKEDDEKKDDTDDDKSMDLEMTDNEETDDEVLQGKEQVKDNEDEEMTNAKVEESRNGDEEDTDVAKADAEKIKQEKDDSKKAELPPTSSSLSTSSGFGDHFLELSSDMSLIVLTQVQETPLAAPVTNLTPPSVSTISLAPLQQTTAPIPSPPITTDAQTITTDVPKSDELSAVQLRVAKLEKDASKLMKLDHYAKAFATLKSQIPMVLKTWSLCFGVPSNMRMTKTLQRGSSIGAKGISFGVGGLGGCLNHSGLEVLAVLAGPNQGKKKKRRRTKESESSKKSFTTKETPKGKVPSKGSKPSKSASSKEPVKEPIAEVVMDDAGEDVVRDDDQPQDTSEPKTAKTPNPECVKKLHGYGHLEEVVVKRSDRQLCKFKEGDFVDLHLNDIEDLLLAIQQKLFYLNESDIANLLWLFKQVMHADELYKFSDGTLKKVRDEIHHRVLDFHLGYNKEMLRRKQTAIDRKRSQLMVELINKQMCERKIIQNLERLVGARELETDYKLMMHTV
nr:hypothetical protein [Tanacetum cinerariifolium]